MTTRKQILSIIIGSFILAFGLFNFNDQNAITEGGSLGLGLLLKNLFHISPSLSLLVLDLVAFSLGIKFFGRSFLLKSIGATICFSFFYFVFEQIGYVVPNLQSNMLAGSIFAGIFVGIGAGLIVRVEAAANGDDSIALIVNRVTKISIGKAYLLMDLTVILLSLLYLPFSALIYSIIAVTISSFLIDKIATFTIEKESSRRTA